MQYNTTRTEDYEDTKLHEAVRYGDINDVRESLNEGEDPNQIGIYQWNPLHEAANNGDLDIVKLLLKHGANPNTPDSLKGCTALHYASSNGFCEVLSCLLDCGGLYDVQNKLGQTCLDVSSDFHCQKLLRKSRDRDVVSKQSPNLVLEDTEKPSDSNNNSNSVDNRSIYSDLDAISLDTTSSTSSKASRYRAWQSNTGAQFNEDLALGHVQLSFEYNAKKEVFKVRVWALADILLPPRETSMIRGIYVKSYLQPDHKNDTKRKTEEIVTEKSNLKELKRKGQDNITNFQPGCFLFTRALEYQHIVMSAVKSKVLEIHVCITQKYTRKSFCISTFTLPLDTACKKLVKEKYPLIARSSLSLPENMKVYSCSQLQTGSKHRGRNVHRSGSSASDQSLATPYSRSVSTSPSDLLSIKSDSCESKKSITINVADSDDDLESVLQEITVMGENEKDSRSYSPDHFVLGIDEGAVADEDGFEITTHRPVSTVEVQVHIPRPSNNTAIKIVSSASLDFPLLGVTRLRKPQAKLLDEESSIGLESRPETPTWDYYTESPLFELQRADENREWDCGVCLPVACTLHSPDVHTENPINKLTKDRKGRKR